MNLNEFIEKWGQTLFEAPLSTRLTGDEPPELAEIRLALLDEARAKSYRSGAKKVFPYDLLRVELRGVEASHQPVLGGRFFRRYLEQEVREGLAASGCRFPDHLRVEVEAKVGLPPRGEPWLVVSVSSQDRAAENARVARLIVQEGTANVPEIRLNKARTNIGRVVDVYRAEGLYRRNDLAFVEDTPVNRSVSREHAHILFDRASSEYRLFNDRWYKRDGGQPAECGTWIVRDGMSQEVHRDARGTKLLPGDEIHFGRVVVLFEAV
jgi:hypothetical protein